MTFSQFLNMLFPIIGGVTTQSEFVFTVTENIMEGRFDKTDNDSDHPLSKLEPDTLDRYFNGGKSLSKKNARAIRARLDKNRFEQYLAKFPNDAIEAIGKAMVENGVEISDDIPVSCAELFESILMECAGKKVAQKTHKDVTNQPPISSEDTEFDEEVDLSARKLGKALEKFGQEYYEHDEPNETVFTSLFAVLEMTTFEARKLVAKPIGKLKVFIDNITTTMDEWSKITNQFPYNTSVSGFLVELVRKKLAPALDEYFLFSDDYLRNYLRNRHIDVSQYTTPRDKVAVIFKQAAKGWGVEDFIYYPAEAKSFLDVDNFIEDIIKRLSRYDGNEIIRQINEFIKMLRGQMFVSGLDSANVAYGGSDNYSKISDIRDAIVSRRENFIALYEEICSI